MTRSVRLSSLAARDLQQARDWFDGQEEGLGDKFLSSVEQALERISRNPETYQVALLDLHRAPIRPFQYSLWYRILPDESIVVAALSDRRDLSAAAGAPEGGAHVKPSQPCSLTRRTAGLLSANHERDITPNGVNHERMCCRHA